MPARTTKIPRVPLRSERGQAMVEFALVLPLLLAIVFGAIYFSKYYNWSNDATQLAGAGARLAAVNNVPPSQVGCTSTNLTTYLKCRAEEQGTGFKDAVSNICVEFPAGDTGTTKQIGDPVTVRITVDYPSVNLPLGLGSLSIGAKSKSATMRLEQTPGAQIAATCP
jgi:Flp pilus assembly protein TadG